jgi:hypothetical protein
MYANAYAEGRGSQELEFELRRAGSSDISIPPFYVRTVVLEVIHDPRIMTDEKIAYFEHKHNVSNIKFAKNLPRNTIVGKQAINARAPSSLPAMFFFPFMPSHIAMPIKVGEHVWTVFEDPTATNNDVGWWLWRIIELDHVDDVNHSHLPRSIDVSFFKDDSTKNLYDGNVEPTYDFLNGVGDFSSDGTKVTIPETAYLEGGNDEYVKILTQSNASKLTRYENVPRYRKRPSELAFEGSNNTLIVLGDDRRSASSTQDTTQDDTVIGPTHKIPDGDVPGSKSGRIDLVVGRGQTAETAGNFVINSLDRNELAKHKTALVDREGDIDYIHDRSRLMLSQRTVIDTNLELVNYNKENFGIEDTKASEEQLSNSSGDAAGLLISDKIRLIARSDLELLVTSYQLDENGLPVIIEDQSKWASIVIRGSDGCIIFKPAETGYIKLGSDNANKAILCTDIGVKQVEGTVSASPIISTMGGALGRAENTGQGVWASKVLIE